MRVLFVILLLTARATHAAEEPSELLRSIKLEAPKEPEYQSKPHYALVVFGADASHRSWLVVDGEDVVYFDRNGNQDLTDPEDHVPLDVAATQRMKIGGDGQFKGMNVFTIGDVEGVNLVFRHWVRNHDFQVTPTTAKHSADAFQQRRKHDWEQGTISRLTSDGRRSRNGTVLTATPEEAQITQFGGKLQFIKQRGDKQELLPWPKQTIFDLNIGTPSRPALHCDYKVAATLTEWEFPRDLHPLATFEFPPATAGEDPIVRIVKLDKRCCGDTVSCIFPTPRNIGDGNVKVIVSYHAWPEGDVFPTTFDLPIRRGVSDDSEQSIVFFRQKNKAVTIKDIQNALDGIQAKVEQRTFDDQTFLRVRTDPDNQIPYLSIKLEQGDAVVDFAAELAGAGELAGEGKQFRMLGDCNAQIRIYITDFSQGDNHPKVLGDVEHALQVLTGGGVYRTWTPKFTPPIKK